LFSIFKKRWFCLFKIATQWVSLWRFHVYMYQNPNWLIKQSFRGLFVCDGFFWDRVSNYLPRLALNHHPSSWSLPPE
jgi:hypothetical protein